MDVTTPQSEPDQDNSSLQNPSTNPAEAGTTDETRDDDHETSSIEALNWSEVEEEELAAAQQAEAALSTALGILPPEKKVNNKTDKDDDNVTTNDSSTNEEGSVLSTSLLQSINSTVADEDPQARKLSVIENWASEVTSAVERGEIEMAEDFPEENETTAGEEDDNNDFVGARKRKGKKSSPELVASMMSTVSNGESSVDPLSNAAVLDDGPIWNKGPRSYTFQENRRINQKLTFCLLIAVVLAIGLGLGNLVAHQECEAEFRATTHQQQPETKHTDKVSVHTVPTPTTPAPIIPDRSTDSSMMGSQLPNKRPISYADSSISEERINDQFASSSVNTNDKRQVRQESIDQGERRRRRDEPVIDPKYKVHAETVSNVVHTLDRLSREIDQNENTTRKLQGVLMIPEEEEKSTETTTESNLLYDEEIYMDEEQENIVDDSDTETDVDDDENEGAIIEDLIEAIEQTPDYIEMQSEKRRWEEYDKNEKNRRHSNLFDTDSEQGPSHPGEQNDMEMLIKSMRQFKEFQRRFIGSERKRLRQDQKYNRFNWRLPEEYTAEEKNALRVRYRSNWQDFLKLIKTKISDPVEALFGIEEDEEERTYEDIFRFSYVDPKDEQSELDLLQKRKDSPSKNENDVENGRGQTWETNSDSKIEEPIAILRESEDIHDTIKMETREEQQLTGEPITASFKSEPVQPERVEANDELGKSTNTAGQGTLESSVPKVENIQPTIKNGDLKVGDSSKKLKGKQGEKDSVSSVKENRATLPISSPPVNKPRKANSQDKVTIDRKPRAQSADASLKTGKVQSKKQTDQKNNQGKQNLKSESMGFNNDQNANTGGVKNRNSGKEKKVRNIESNTSFENLKGKNKKRAASSPERNGNAGTEALFAEVKHEKNSNPSFPKKKSQIEDNENKENKRGRGDTSFDKENQKVKAPDNQNNNDNHQNKFNGNNNARSYKNDQSKDARYQERRNARTEQRNRQQSNENQQKNKEKASAYPERSSSKPNQGIKDISSEETQFQQQKTDFNVKHESRNNYKNSGNQNGKKSKSWQSKEKTDRKKERGSSWGN